jgi:hypothetical protein
LAWNEAVLPLGDEKGVPIKGAANEGDLVVDIQDLDSFDRDTVGIAVRHGDNDLP